MRPYDCGYCELNRMARGALKVIWNNQQDNEGSVHEGWRVPKADPSPRKRATVEGDQEICMDA